MKRSVQKVWHVGSSTEVLEWLCVDRESGLSDKEIASRQNVFGLNKISQRRPQPWWLKFFREFRQPLVLILLAAGGITAVLHQWVDSSVIFGVVLVNSIVGFIQEAKAETALDSLSQMVAAETSVRRNGRTQQISAEQLVPGDIILLESGTRVPADLRLLAVKGLQVDESSLTGESVPVSKHADSLKLDTFLTDRKNLAYAGTLVTSGRAEGVVWATGNRTETGRIAWLIREADDLQTPLLRKIARFSRVMLWIILGFVAVAFVVGVARGESPFDMFIAAVALAVGAIPEGLPAAVTIVLAIGVSRMAERRAIIRKLPAVETLGSTTVICSDKTGTITKNQMTVREIFAADKLFQVTGAGYDTNGSITLGGETVNLAAEPALTECLRAGVLCNDSKIIRENDIIRVHGDPTEAALLVAAQKGGLLHTRLIHETPRLDMIPFESEHMFRATLHDAANSRVIYKVGALERLLDRCADTIGTSGQIAYLDKEKVQEVAEQMASRGLRVLALARRHVPRNHSRLEHSHVREGLTFLGLQAMIDPPRPEAISAVRRCQTAGIAVKMITGDNLVTARAIAAQIGLSACGREGYLEAISGRDLDKVSDADFSDVAEKTVVFARVTPEQKLRLVRALQSRSHVVAVTGDGVNDAPALKQADIGIAMGVTGTEVAKGAADMVLTDDNFATIEAAIDEGRAVFDNLTRFIVWTLPTTTGEAFILLAAIVFGATLPILPVQLLWINMMTSVFLGLMLVFEPKEPGLMHRPPRDPKRSLLTFALAMRTGLVALMILAGGFWLFFWELKIEGHNIAAARTAVVNCIVLVETAYLFNCRSLSRSFISAGLLSNRWALMGSTAMILAQLVFTYVSPVANLFHAAPIDTGAWIRILAVAVGALVIVEIEKFLRYGRHFDRQLIPE